MKSILLCLLMIFPLLSSAQEGYITVVQDSGIDKVLKLYQTFAKEKRLINGFRIQLGSNINRKELMDMRVRFLQLYPSSSAYIEYQQPQFKLRVGDFRTRSDAAAFMEEVRENFTSVFIVPDKVYVQGGD